MRKIATANEAPKLTLDEQRGAPFVLTPIELQEEGLQVLPHHAVQYSVLREAANIASREVRTDGGCLKLHER